MAAFLAHFFIYEKRHYCARHVRPSVRPPVRLSVTSRCRVSMILGDEKMRPLSLNAVRTELYFFLRRLVEHDEQILKLK
jgi:hypothetical protein